MPFRHSLRVRKPLTAPPSPESPPSPPSSPITTTRPRRTAAAPSTIYSRHELDEDSSEGEGRAVKPRQTLRLTVKMPSSRLREATNVATQDAAPVASTRSTRNIKKSYVVETSSEEEDEEEEQEDYADADAEGEEDDIAEEATPNPQLGEEEEDDDDDEDEGAEAEMEAEMDADGDIEMDDDADDGVPLGHHPPPPILKVNPPAAPKAKPVVTVKPAESTKLKSVEAKEISMDGDDDDDDEELSELGSDDEEEEEEVEEEAADEDDEDDEIPSAENDSRSPSALSRGTTPDINKMTKRQRSRLNEVYTAATSAGDGGSSGGGGGGGGFLELPMEPQVKKHLTAEEHAMRRAEMARRRKNLSEKRNEEEKQETINRLLKKQAPKRRGKISAREIEAQDRGDMSEAEQELAAAAAAAAADRGVEVVPATPVFVRWVSDGRGCRVGVPGEWLGTPAGEVFVSHGGGGGGVNNGSGKMVEEVEG